MPVVYLSIQFYAIVDIGRATKKEWKKRKELLKTALEEDERKEANISV